MLGMTSIAIEHFPDCKNNAAVAAAWSTRWPDHCPYCWGAGYKMDRSGLDLDHITGSVDMVICQNCLDASPVKKCPRCGLEQPKGAAGQLSCSGCGWAETLVNPALDDADPETMFFVPDPGEFCYCDLQSF